VNRLCFSLWAKEEARRNASPRLTSFYVSLGEINAVGDANWDVREQREGGRGRQGRSYLTLR